MHSLNMNHLYFLHFPTIFTGNHFWNSIFYFSWKLLCLLKLFSLSLPQQSGKPFCCCVMFLGKVNSWWLTTSKLGNQFTQKHLKKSTIIFHCLFKYRFHVAVHLFSNSSHVMSEYGKNKKVAHKMWLKACSRHSVIKMKQNRCDSSRGVKKWGRW